MTSISTGLRPLTAAEIDLVTGGTTHTYGTPGNQTVITTSPGGGITVFSVATTASSKTFSYFSVSPGGIG